MSVYFSGPRPGFAGKAASLAANEKTVTPAESSPAVKAAAGSAGPPGPAGVRKAPAPLPATSNSPYFPGQQPDHYQILGRVGTRVPIYKPRYYGKPGPTGDAATGWNAQDAATAARIKFANEGGLVGALLRAPLHPFENLGQGLTGQRTVTAGGVVSDLANIGSNLVPAGKAAGIFGMLKGLRDAQVLKDSLSTAETVGKAAGEVTPTIEAKAMLRGTLRGARGVRGRQEAGYSLERSKRFTAANEHLTNKNLAPEERIRLAKEELKGELPKIDFQGMKVLDSASLKQLQTHILDHPHLLPAQKIRASEALTNAVAGKVPTRSELTLLEHVFGKDTAAGLGGVTGSPFKDTLLSVLNVPRSLMASFDLSAPFRQGLVVSTRHPTIFARNFAPMVKAFGSEKFYGATLADIRARPTYPMMIEAKLSLTDLGTEVGGREERFASDYAEKLTGGKRISPVRMSGRAYTGFLDKTRADVFDHLIQRAQAQGIDVQDQQFLRGLGSYINSATGRGDLGHFQEAGKVLNTFFFSPRLLASRLNFMNPLYYARLDPFARKEALRSAIQLAGTLSTLLGLASQIPGVKVVMDPRNPDWGKIKIGNTRIDVGGGFQQPLRLFAQLATGTAISSTTGKALSLTSTGYGKPNRLDMIVRFFEGKEAPWASVVTDKLRNTDQVGKKFAWSREAYSHMVPLIAQDAADLYNSKHGGMNGLAAAFAGYGIESVGFGLQTYGPKPAKPAVQAPADYFGGSSSGTGNGYFGGSGSGSGSGNGYFGAP